MYWPLRSSGSRVTLHLKPIMYTVFISTWLTYSTTTRGKWTIIVPVLHYTPLSSTFCSKWFNSELHNKNQSWCNILNWTKTFLNCPLFQLSWYQTWGHISCTLRVVLEGSLVVFGCLDLNWKYAAPPAVGAVQTSCTCGLQPVACLFFLDALDGLTGIHSVHCHQCGQQTQTVVQLGCSGDVTDSWYCGRTFCLFAWWCRNHITCVGLQPGSSRAQGHTGFNYTWAFPWCS